MSNISNVYAKAFLEQQEKLFDFPVADTVEEAKEFLEDCFAQVFNNFKELMAYLEEEGLDIEGVSKDNLDEILEVFIMPDGKYLYVAG